MEGFRADVAVCVGAFDGDEPDFPALGAAWLPIFLTPHAAACSIAHFASAFQKAFIAVD